MLKQEFEERVQMKVSLLEYRAIETVYNGCDFGKDEFCKMWVKMNKSRVEEAKNRRKAAEKEEVLRTKLYGIYEKYNFKDNAWKTSHFPACTLNKGELNALADAKIPLSKEHYILCDISDILWSIRSYLDID